MKKIIFSCNNCKETFEDYKTNRNGKYVFCSKDCHNKWQIGNHKGWWQGKSLTEKHKENLRKAKENEKERPWRRTGGLVNCFHCNKKVYKEKNWFGKYPKPYCSQNCANKVISKGRIDACRKLGKSMKGIKLSKEHKEKISETRKKLIREGKIRMEFPKEDTKI